MRAAAIGTERFEEHSLSKPAIIGWVICLGGLGLWLFGYYVSGGSPLIDWQAHTPWWIADYLPNVNSEIGMALMFAGSALTCWPPNRQ